MRTHRVPADQIGPATAAIRRSGRPVLTFLGYSGSGYARPDDMLRAAESILSQYAPDVACVCIGGTSAGIGAIYPLAKALGFRTLGVVSALILHHPESRSPYCDELYVVDDDSWGGIHRGSLSPTSALMVGCSDRLVALGGGEVTCAEIRAALELGKPVTEIPMARAAQC